MKSVIGHRKSVIGKSRTGFSNERCPTIPELSQAKLERIRRSIVESFDRTRYVIVAPLGERGRLYFRVEDACFGSHISQATPFKSRQTAEAVRRSIGSSRVRRKLRIVRAKKTKVGLKLASAMGSSC